VESLQQVERCVKRSTLILGDSDLIRPLAAAEFCVSVCCGEPRLNVRRILEVDGAAQYSLLYRPARDHVAAAGRRLTEACNAANVTMRSLIPHLRHLVETVQDFEALEASRRVLIDELRSAG
jgi:hypothetical protein